MTVRVRVRDEEEVKEKDLTTRQRQSYLLDGCKNYLFNCMVTEPAQRRDCKRTPRDCQPPPDTCRPCTQSQLFALPNHSFISFV